MPLDGEAIPHPKPARLPRKPYRRQVASRKQWARIVAEKTGPCRVCGSVENGRVESKIQLHHVVSRSHGGADTADNIIPLCLRCHDAITRREPLPSYGLLLTLTDAEYAYMIERGGELYAERAYGLRYAR
jgi:5-methylcytosine-specific restriction endonuclease McrA